MLGFGFVRVPKIWHVVREQQDSWPDELVRLGGAGILVCGMRLGGKVFIGDLALLLWFVGGGSHVRIYKRYMLPIQCTRRVSCLHHAWQPGTDVQTSAWLGKFGGRLGTRNRQAAAAVSAAIYAAETSSEESAAFVAEVRSLMTLCRFQ